MSLVVPLAGAIGVSRFGGKANVLAEMLSFGLPVPLGFVIAAEAQDEIGNEAGRSQSHHSETSAQLAVELRRAWEENIGSSMAAVRSSAFLEDSADASFAGQFHTALNVGSVEDLLDAVRDCWESLYTDHASAYAVKKTGMSAKGARRNRMAVIVQQMVDAEFAGVVFSNELETSSSEVLYAEWVDGLGEKLVGGESIGGRCWLDSNGRELRVDHLGESSPSSSVWRDLADIVWRIEQHFGVPQDVEWAVSRTGRLHILQARPITTQPNVSRQGPPPWVLPGRPAGGWTELQRRYFDLWDEYCPETVTPLDYELFYREIWQASLLMLDQGKGVPAVDEAVIRFHKVPIALNPGAELRLQANRDRRSTLEAELSTWRPQVESLKERIGDLREIDDAGLIEIVEEAGGLHGGMMSMRLLGMFEWIDGERSMAAELACLVGSDDIPEEVLDDLCAGVEHETARMNVALETLMHKSASATDRSQWLADFDRFIDRFGHMEINGTVVHCAKDELIKYVETGAGANGETNHSNDFPAVGRERSERQRKRLSERVDDLQRETLDQCIGRLRELRALREDSKSLANLPLPVLRDTISECTQRLHTRRVLSTDATAELLTLTELRNGLFLAEALPDVRVRQNAIEWKQQRSWLPAGFLGETCSSTQHSFTGLGASRGSAIGPARVVRGIADFAKVKQGDVLVAASTNPAWTILFGRVAAIAIENGSRLSHAAIVAREYGIPAVVGLPGICDIIEDGEEVQVDGSIGTVKRLVGQERANA